jgi:hypothetical protein
MKKEIKNKKVSKKKVKVAPVIEEPVATESETAPVNEQPSQMIFIQEKLPTLRGNIYRQEEINNKVELVMAFRPQISKGANGLYSVVIGSTLDKGICTEGETVLKAMIKMFDQLT